MLFVFLHFGPFLQQLLKTVGLCCFCLASSDLAEHGETKQCRRRSHASGETNSKLSPEFLLNIFIPFQLVTVSALLLDYTTTG